MLSDKIVVFQNCAGINFTRDGHLSPALIAEYSNSEINVYSADFNSPDDKEKFADFIRHQIIEKQLIEYIFVAESWMSLYEKDGSFVKKIEAITMTYCSKFLPYETGHYAEIKRFSEDTVLLGEWIEFGKTFGSEGNFSNLFLKCSHEWN